jgi:hypothetical protein
MFYFFNQAAYGFAGNGQGLAKMGVIEFRPRKRKLNL